MSSHWLEQGTDFQNVPPTVTILEPQAGLQIQYPGPTTFQAMASDTDGQILRVTLFARYEQDNTSVGTFRNMEKVGDVWEVQLTWSSWTPRHAYWTVWITATDNEGAIAESEKVTVFLD